MNQEKTIKSLILAAGFGTRLRPLTLQTPKPLLPILNQPMLETILRKISRLGISIAVNTHHLSERVLEFVENSAFVNHTKTYYEPEILGTGGPFVNAKNFLSDSDAIVLHNGDILADFDLDELLKHHFHSANLATLVLIDGPENRVTITRESDDYGIIHDILDKLERRPENSVKLTYSGIAAFSPEIFHFLPQEPEFCSIVTAIIQGIRAFPGKVGAYLPNSFYWNDIGTLKQYYQAHENLLKNPDRFEFSRAGFATPEGAILVGDNCSIAPSARLSGFNVIGNYVRIPESTRLTDCIVLEHTTLSEEESYSQEIVCGALGLHRDIRELDVLRILENFDLEHCRVKLLVEQGSNRKFYRIRESSPKSSSQVLMISVKDDLDFDRFIEYGTYFSAIALATPAIFAEDRNEFTVLMEDLGDLRLYDAVDGLPDSDIASLYSRVIAELCDFQVMASAKLGDYPDVRFRDFGYDYFRWETSYFRENYLENIVGIDPAETARLDEEFHALAVNVKKVPHLIIHRDFQSQNIMVSPDRIRFVDFQGARMAPFTYDVMSLTQDPYVALPATMRQRLQEYYFDTLRESLKSVNPDGNLANLSSDDFAYFCILSALQRNMQALGAYGFLSLVKGKMQYQHFIPQGLSYLKETVERLSLADSGFDMPELRRILEMC